MHGCGGWLGLVLYIGPGWGYGGGPRRGVGRCGLPQHKGGGEARPRAGAGPYHPDQVLVGHKRRPAPLVGRVAFPRGSSSAVLRGRG
eukprot:scaffold16744_cov101-Isochrysis_galbana.AAC.2